MILSLVLGGISGFGGTIILSVPGRIALARTMRGKFLALRAEDTPTTVHAPHCRSATSPTEKWEKCPILAISPIWS